MLAELKMYNLKVAAEMHGLIKARPKMRAVLLPILVYVAEQLLEGLLGVEDSSPCVALLFVEQCLRRPESEEVEKEVDEEEVMPPSAAADNEL